MQRAGHPEKELSETGEWTPAAAVGGDQRGDDVDGLGAPADGLGAAAIERMPRYHMGLRLKREQPARLVGGLKTWGESNMHQIMVTISCRLRPPFP